MRRRLVLLFLPPLFAIVTLTLASNNDRGAVVWRAFAPDATSIDECLVGGEADRLACLRQAYANLAWRDGAAAAMRALWEEPGRREVTLGSCHRIAHLIGEAVWTRLRGDLGRAIPEISEDFEADPLASDYFYKSGDCVDGLFHGLLEREFADRPDPVSAIDDLAVLCSDRALWDDNAGVSVLRCVHGLGHGAMIVSDNDLTSALRLCDRTSAFDDAGWPDLCGSGAFMEYVAPTVSGGTLVDEGAPLRVCTEIDDRYEFQCYTHIVREVLRRASSVSGADLVCSAIDSIEGKSACAFEVGLFLDDRTDTPRSLVEAATSTCRSLAPHLIACLNGVLEERSRDRDPLLAVSIACESFPESLRYSCGIVAEVRRDWREISPSDCTAIADPRVRAGCEWSARADFDPRISPDPPLPLE